MPHRPVWFGYRGIASASCVTTVFHPGPMAVGTPDAATVTSGQRVATNTYRHVLERDVSDRL